MRRFIKLRSVLCLVLVLGLSFGFFLNDVFAAQPNTINYQGRLYDLTNTPLSGQYDFQFRLYDDDLKTTLLWGPEEFVNQGVNNGYFSVYLGSIEDFASAGIDFTNQYYLTIQIKETAAGVWDNEADPPVPFNSYAYSFNTQKLENPSGFVDIGLGILAGYQLAGAETAFQINTSTGFSGKLLSLSNDGLEYLSVAGDGELHWMDGGYADAYFNVENVGSPYSGNPNFAGLYLDSNTNRSTLFGEFVYMPGALGLGTMAPGSKLDVKGAVSFGGMPTSPVSNMGDARIYYDGGLNQLLLSKNAGPYEAVLTAGDQVWQQNLLVLSPTDPLVEKIEISKSVNNLIGMKITNTNDVNNYAGSVIELKGSGADYTNNLYFGKYGAGFWVPSWAGNGVLATDNNLVIAAVGGTSAINFQVGGGYTTPNNVASLTNQGLVLLPYGTLTGNTGTLALRELVTNGTNSIILRSPDALAGDVTLTLPVDGGTAGQVLTTDGSGILSWGTAAAPAVDNGLYNDGGTLKLGGDLVEMTYINHQGFDLIVREFAGETETIFSGDNFKIIDAGNNREIRYGIGGIDHAGLSFKGNNQHDIYYRDDYLYVNSNSLAFSGLQYAADYSGDFVNRSLVDKEYVDSNIGALTLQDVADNTIASMGYVYADFGSSVFEDDGGQTRWQADAGGFEMAYGEAGGSYLRFKSAGAMDPAVIELRDNRGVGNAHGIEYAADYSVDYTNRSLVDKEYVDGLLGAGGGVTTLNLTATTFDGNFSYAGDTGYVAGNAVCGAEYPGSHFCTTNEVITVIYSGDISAWSGTAWIAEGPPGYTANSNDCNGWTSNTSTDLGAFWEFNNTSGGMGWLTNCASVKPVACCQ